jgi:hypothetical protein
MKINVHIERLVLEELPISASERPWFQVALETELTQLLRAGRLSPELIAGASLARMQAGAIQTGHKTNPANLGADVARSVHQVLGREATRRANAGRRFPAKERRLSQGDNWK